MIVNMMGLIFSFELEADMQSSDKCIIAHFKYYLANSAVLHQGLLNKFLQIPLATTAHN